MTIFAGQKLKLNDFFHTLEYYEILNVSIKTSNYSNKTEIGISSNNSRILIILLGWQYIFIFARQILMWTTTGSKFKKINQILSEILKKKFGLLNYSILVDFGGNMV